MRYAKEHKEAARQRLVKMGGSFAKQHGFGDSGIASLAAAAGVTTGSLYKHFDGKADFFAAVVAAELQRTADLFGAIEPGDQAGATKANAAYLSTYHVQHPELGCPLPALTQEVARAEGPVRDVFDAGVAEIHAKVERLTRSADRAWALIAQNVGAVMLARALKDPAQRKALLHALRSAGEQTLAKSRSMEA
jgi:TetR/AcrR family transcriptional regulator, transcriptional repressor for nem operon